MGVPAFYRWLVNKYPQVVAKVMEHNTATATATTTHVDDFEFDNLYLDMNGIIHPCFHPTDGDAPTTFHQVFENIYAYIDRLVRIVRPRNLLYLAIDGVAPRAKMNQQRSRRFRAAKDNEIAEEEERKLREQFESKGKTLLPKLHSQVSDSNVITPGTEFMHDLSKALNLYILGKLNNDPSWSQLQVIVSDDTVPGEGEHKIMSFIRSKRSLPGYDPNTRHCLYGLDADLIMLALATHELYFSILREDMLGVQEEAPVSELALDKSIQKAAGEHYSANLSGDKLKPSLDINDKKRLLLNQPQHFEYVHVWILREYLELDMQILDPPEKFVYDVERIIDDFVFICFFVGNDFLPHMPTLEIHENAIDLLMYVYKKEFRSLGGYLVDMQRVNDQHADYMKLKRVEKFILSVGSYEEKIFKKRADIRERKLRRILRELLESEAEEVDHEGFEVSGTDPNDRKVEISQQRNASSDTQDMVANTKLLKEKLKDCIRKKSDIFRDVNMGRDKVKLGAVGWKQRYYKEKFLVEDPKETENTRKEIVQKYTEGLCWVLLYYFSGIPSWNWYYPHHYGPFASDLRGLAGVKVRFEKGFPFRPFDQLMAVLPPKSAHALPRVYQELMTDNNSSIIEYYPNDFEVDVDGKRFLWQGICKLPFIEQKKLLDATKQVEHKVEKSEAKRNVQTTDKLYTRASRSSEKEFGGYLRQHTEIEDDIMHFNFELAVPCFHIPRLLEGTQAPIKTIFEKDIEETVLWHEYNGRPPFSRCKYNATTIEIRKSKTYDMHDDYIKTAGPEGFSAGRGKGSTSSYSRPSSQYTSVNQRHQQSGYMQSTSTYHGNNIKTAGPCGFSAGRGKGSTTNYSRPSSQYTSANQRHQQPGYMQSTSTYYGNNIKTAGLCGFSAGRGKGSTTNYPRPSSQYTSVNQRHQQSGYMQSTSTCYGNSRGMANFRVSSSNSGITQNSFRPMNNSGAVPHENSSLWRWQPLSNTTPIGFSSEGFKGSSLQFRPHRPNADAPQFIGRGGRARSGPQSYYSTERHDYRDHNH